MSRYQTSSFGFVIRAQWAVEISYVSSYCDRYKLCPAPLIIHMIWLCPDLHHFIFHLFFMALLIVKLKRWQETGQERGEWHAAKGPRLGVKPGSAAVRTSLCTWDTCATNWAQRRPWASIFKSLSDASNKPIRPNPLIAVWSVKSEEAAWCLNIYSAVSLTCLLAR